MKKLTHPVKNHSRRQWIGAAALLMCLPGISQAQSSDPPTRSDRPQAGEVVVLLHGWWANPATLLRLECSLRAAGYKVVNLSYRSVRVPLERTAVNRLPKLLAKKIPVGATRVHFVTHSLGGLLLREYLAHHRPANLGRIVMLAPPNHGSELADGTHAPFIRWLAGPNFQYLRTTNPLRPTSPSPEIEIGIVASDTSFFPPFKKLPKPNDGRVTVESTRLATMTDHCVVHIAHSLLPWNGKVLHLVKQFLATGGFETEL